MSHIRERSSGYYFRKTIPEDLRAVLGKREFVITLRTYSRRVAKIKASYLSFIVNNSYQFARSNLGVLEVSAIRQTALNLISEATESLGREDSEASLIGLANALGKPMFDADTPPLGPLASSVIQDYFQHKSVSGEWVGRTAVESQPPFDLFLELVGDKPVDAYTRDDMRAYRDSLLRMPSSRKKRPQYREKTARELLNMDIPEAHLLRKKTVNSHIILLGSCFKWMVGEGLLSENVMEGLQVKESDSISYQPYTRGELKRLLSADVFTQPDNRFNRTYKFWTPLLGLYTGARLNELCQLRVGDIGVSESGVWFIDINDEEDRSTKNKTSVRRTPIHNMLIEIGFIDYVKHQYAAGHEMLFPDLKKGAQSWKDNASKSYANIAKKAGIKGDRSKCFHSFRKNAVDAIAVNAPKDSLVSAIVGHKQMGMTFSRYFSQYPLEELKAVIDLIDYKLEVSHLVGVWRFLPSL